jgi:hypothetical protein
MNIALHNPFFSMNDRWDSPFKISQNCPDMPTRLPTGTQKQVKKIILKIFFSRNKTGRVKKLWFYNI